MLPTTAAPIDFSKTPLSRTYAPFYAKVIDGVFTPAECRALLALVGPDASSGVSWQPAGLSTAPAPTSSDSGGSTQTVHTGFRNSDRALLFSAPEASAIYDRLRPHVPELHKIAPSSRWGCITGKQDRKQGPTWALAGVNPRLSFLRYGPGHYFKPHCDGLNEFDGRKSFVTLHIYLNDAENDDIDLDPGQGQGVLPTSASLPPSSALPPSSLVPQPTSPEPPTYQDSDPLGSPEVPLKGGATRFWTPDKKAFLDVHPKMGRVLIFQQRMLVHSGEAVTQGLKYTVRSDFMFEEVVR